MFISGRVNGKTTYCGDPICYCIQQMLFKIKILYKKKKKNADSSFLLVRVCQIELQCRPSFHKLLVRSQDHIIFFSFRFDYLLVNIYSDKPVLLIIYRHIRKISNL